MADQANIVGKVTADTSQAVRSVGDLKRAVDTAGSAWSRFSESGSKAIDQLATGFAKFNLALGGVQKALQLATDVAEMVKFAAEVRNAETRVKALGVSAYDMATAVGGSVDDVSLLRFGLKQLQGESALTKDQLLLVLKAADNLGDQGFGETMKIAEDLAKALKGGPTKALREYNIEIDESIKGTKQVSGLMEKFREIADEPVAVDAQLEAIERVGAGWKNMVAEVKIFVAEVLTSIYDMFDDLTDYIAGVNGGGGAIGAATRAINDDHFRQQKLERMRKEESAVLPTTVTDKLKPKKQRGAGGGGKRGGRETPGNIDVEGMLADAWEAEDFFEDTSAADLNARVQADAQETLAKLKASTTDLQGSFAALAQELGYADNEYTRALELQQQRIDQNIAQAASEYTVQSALNNTTASFEALFQAIADGQNPFAAFLKASANLMKAQAIRDAALAVSAGAAALFGINPAGNAKAAAMFAKSAALNAAGAVVVGALAGSGGGGGSPSSPSAGGFAGPTLSGSPDAGGFTINVQGNLYGDPAAFGRAVVEGMERAQQSGRTRLRPNRNH